MRKILVTGSYGQLGSEIKERHGKLNNCIFHFHDKDTLDLFNYINLENYPKTLLPDFIINCAAYTAVDKAESDKESAMLLNAEVPGKLASLANKYNARLIHISTDYVFDGKNFKPYKEADETNPQSYYGLTKLEGEKNVLQYTQHSVVRTSWLYSGYGANFVKTMLHYGHERDSLNVVFDQIGSPTYAGDLAEALLNMVTFENSERCQGIFHFSNEGICSWYDFAKTIMELSETECKIFPIESKDYPLPAPRPFYSVLNKSKIKSTFNINIPYWKDSLKISLSRLT